MIPRFELSKMTEHQTKLIEKHTSHVDIEYPVFGQLLVLPHSISQFERLQHLTFHLK